MVLFRLFVAILLLSIAPVSAFAQKGPVYELEKRLMKGDKKALFEIAAYFSSSKQIVEYLGYHIIHTTESTVAKRVVEENCVFTKDEIEITPETTAKQFEDFLNRFNERITYSALADAFLVTPLEARTAKVDFRQVTKSRQEEFKKRFAELIYKDWVVIAGIDLLISKKDPKALLLIASELFKGRYRYDRYEFNKHEYTELLQAITHTEIAVEDESKNMTWHIDKTFYPDASLNLLIYLSTNYTRYTWDDELQAFKIDSISINTVSRENELFQLLPGKDDSVAMNAFIQLTTCDPAKVTELADEYGKARIDVNFSIPSYGVLKQLAVFTEYCRANNIDFVGPPAIRQALYRLNSDLSFTETRKLEDSLINKLTLEDITALEYWGLVHLDLWSATYSMGRIVDVFYSKNWNKLVAKEAYLAAYLKKSFHFQHMGVGGVVTKYMTKFTNNGMDVAARLSQIRTEDSVLQHQIDKAKQLCLAELQKPNDPKKFNDANADFNVTNIEENIRRYLREIEKEQKKLKGTGRTWNEKGFDLMVFLSKINYSQIGTTLRAMERLGVQSNDNRDFYEFMKDDWGFITEENFNDSMFRRQFLGLYDKLSEYELYCYFLDKAGIDYKNGDGSLDYDKIYELIKFNIVAAFAGGGGGKYNNEVYSLIKLLELTHRTTLGYPVKLCNSIGMYACYADDRSREWMWYLKEKGLLKEKHDEPVSFSY